MKIPNTHYLWPKTVEYFESTSEVPEIANRNPTLLPKILISDPLFKQFFPKLTPKKGGVLKIQRNTEEGRYYFRIII
jgi:DNA-directed RNA polymerase subunit H (RpoH/RPB5)